MIDRFHSFQPVLGAGAKNKCAGSALESTISAHALPNVSPANNLLRVSTHANSAGGVLS